MKKESENIENNKKFFGIIAIFFVIILIILIILYLGFITYKENIQNMIDNSSSESKEPNNESKGSVQEKTSIESNPVASTRLVGVINALNNPFIENVGENIGYIYNKGFIDVNSLSNDYIIYTALYYLKERNELEDNNEPKYQKKVSKILVDSTIKNIFGDITYNANAYLGNGITCPNGYYEPNEEYFYINTNCETGTNKVENYNIKIVQGMKSVDIYQAIGYVSYNGTKRVYKDKAMKELVAEDDNYEISIKDYNNFMQYKFSFTKGSDNLYHFHSVDVVS